MKKLTIVSLLLTPLLALSLFSTASAQLTDNITDTTASTCVNLTKDMRSGSKDSTTDGQVSDLQFFLNDKGYLKTDPTGYFGAATLVAVKAFQADNGVSQTGNVGPLTRSKISSVSCSNDEPVIVSPVSTIYPPTPVAAPTVMFSYFGKNAAGQAVTVQGGSSATDIDPRSPRTWSWKTTGAASVTARYTVSGSNCSVALPYGGSLVENNWQPWVGASAIGNQTSGSNTRTLGTGYYNCTITASVTAKNATGVVTSEVKIVFSNSPAQLPVDPYVGTLYYCNGVVSHEPCVVDTGPVCGQPKMPSCSAGLLCAQVMPLPKTYTSKSIMLAAGATYLHDGICEVITPESAIPFISSIAPTVVAPQGTITVQGSGFNAKSDIYLDLPSITSAYGYKIAGGILPVNGVFSISLPSSYPCESSVSSGIINPCFASLPITPGTHTLTVKNAGGVSNPVSFTISSSLASQVSISSLSPTARKIGDIFLINGAGFTPNGTTVMMNGYKVGTTNPDIAINNVKQVSSTVLSVTVPHILTQDCDQQMTTNLTTNVMYACGPLAMQVKPGMYQVTVTNSTGAISNQFPLMVTGTVASVPSISIVSPSSAKVGATFTISGSGFTSTGNSVIVDNDGQLLPDGYSSLGSSITMTLPEEKSFPCISTSPQMGLMCRAPQAITPGVHTLTIKNVNGISNSVSFTVLAPTVGTITSCLYAQLPAGCTYVPGPGYIAGQNCNMISSCAETPPSDGISVSTLSAVKQKLITELPLSPSQLSSITVVSSQSATWNDGCMGIINTSSTPACTNVIIHGFIVTLKYNGFTYVYHTDVTGSSIKHEPFTAVTGPIISCMLAQPQVGCKYVAGISSSLLAQGCNYITSCGSTSTSVIVNELGVTVSGLTAEVVMPTEWKAFALAECAKTNIIMEGGRTFSIDWGDGTFPGQNGKNAPCLKHTYQTAGTYRINARVYDHSDANSFNGSFTRDLWLGQATRRVGLPDLSSGVFCTFATKSCLNGSAMSRDAYCGWHPETCPGGAY